MKKAIGLLTVALCLCALVGAVWLVAEGHAEAAVDTLICWGEDGTLSALEAVLMNRVIPMLAGFGTSAFALYLALKKKFKAIDAAKGQMDAATGQAVETYGTHVELNKQMKAFMERERLAAEEQRAAIKLEFDTLAREHRESLAADRGAMRRLEGKVDGMRRATRAAFGATGELVKNGTATRIAHIMEETEGAEASSEEGGDSREEALGDDAEAAEDAQTA